MKRLSLHIGLDRLKDEHYEPGIPSPKGVNDAISMCEIAKACRFEARLLCNDHATAEAVFSWFEVARRSVSVGDTLLITFAGHGSRLKDEDDVPRERSGRDQAWCLYDRLLLDDELAAQLASLPSESRVLVITDSCFGGSILTAPVTPFTIDDKDIPPLARPRAEVNELSPNSTVVRSLPAAVVQNMSSRLATFYADIKKRTPADGRRCIKCTVVLMSACQDDEYAIVDGEHGLFTKELLRVWSNGHFQGSHREFFERIRERISPDIQNPNFDVLGEFPGETPFSCSRPEAQACLRDPSA